MSIYDLLNFTNLHFFWELFVPVIIFLRGQERRPHFWLRLLAVIVLSVPLYFLPISEPYLGPFILTFVLVYVLVIAAAFFCYRISLFNTLFVFVAAFAVQHLAWNIEFMIFESMSSLTAPVGWLIYALITAAVYVACYAVLPVEVIQESTRRENKILLVISALILLVTFVLSSLVSAYSEWTVYNRCYAIVCCILALAAQFGAFEQRRLREEKETLERDRAVMQELWDKERRQYEISKDTIDMVNMKCHDLRSQITLLRHMDEKDRDRTIGKLEETVMIYGKMAKTGNEILDVVLMDKQLYCEKHGIRFTYMVDGERLRFMEAADIVALFGNALDNAIESVAGEAEEERRIIRLNVSAKRSFVCVHLENYCSRQVEFSDGLPLTAKTDKAVHGFGVKSIRYVTEHYGGSMQMWQDGEIFILDVLLPGEPAGAGLPESA